MNRLSPKQYLCLFILFLAGGATLTYEVSAQEGPLRLTLRGAIEKGLQANLGVLVADTRVQELEGDRKSVV